MFQFEQCIVLYTYVYHFIDRIFYKARLDKS